MFGGQSIHFSVLLLFGSYPCRDPPMDGARDLVQDVRRTIYTLLSFALVGSYPCHDPPKDGVRDLVQDVQ